MFKAVENIACYKHRPALKIVYAWKVDGDSPCSPGGIEILHINEYAYAIYVITCSFDKREYRQQQTEHVIKITVLSVVLTVLFDKHHLFYIHNDDITTQVKTYCLVQYQTNQNGPEKDLQIVYI